jgi:MFS family permease
MIVPVGRLVVLRATAKQDLLRSIAYITWPGLAAPILGPPVGGFITTCASWRWIFLLNVPFGLLGVVLAQAVPPSEPGEVGASRWISSDPVDVENWANLVIGFEDGSRGNIVVSDVGLVH